MAGADIDDGSCTGSEPCDLFFSEYAEGSSNNKYLEIYNPTDGPVSLAPTAANQSNGANNSDPAAAEWDYWNDLRHGRLHRRRGDLPDRAPERQRGPARQRRRHIRFPLQRRRCLGLIYSASASFGNGGDWELIDVVEPYGLDPGSGWDVAGVTNGTVNHTLRRKSSISYGNGGDWAASAGTNADDSQWIVLDNDYALNNDRKATTAMTSPASGLQHAGRTDPCHQL